MRNIILMFSLLFVSIIAFCQKPDNVIYRSDSVEIVEGVNWKNERLVWMRVAACDNTYFVLIGEDNINKFKKTLSKVNSTQKETKFKKFVIRFDGSSYSSKSGEAFTRTERGVEYVVFHAAFYYPYKHVITYFDDRVFLRSDVHIDSNGTVFQEIIKLYECYILFKRSEVDDILNVL